MQPSVLVGDDEFFSESGCWGSRAPVEGVFGFGYLGALRRALAVDA